MYPYVMYTNKVSMITYISNSSNKYIQLLQQNSLYKNSVSNVLFILHTSY